MIPGVEPIRVNSRLNLLIDINEIKLVDVIPNRDFYTHLRMPEFVPFTSLHDVEWKTPIIQTVLEKQQFSIGSDTCIRTVQIYVERDKYEAMRQGLSDMLASVNYERESELSLLTSEIRNLRSILWGVQDTVKKYQAMRHVQRSDMCLVHRGIRKDAPCICGRMNDL